MGIFCFSILFPNIEISTYSVLEISNKFFPNKEFFLNVSFLSVNLQFSIFPHWIIPNGQLDKTFQVSLFPCFPIQKFNNLNLKASACCNDLYISIYIG